MNPRFIPACAGNAETIALKALIKDGSSPHARCNYYGDCYYNDGGAAIGGAMFGLALGTMIGAAAAQQQQTQQQVPVCYAPNGNPYFARAMAWKMEVLGS